MTRQSPNEAIAGALVTQLRAHAGVTALVGAKSYTDVEQAEAPPYVKLSFPTGRRVDTASLYGKHTLVDAIAVTQGNSKRPGVRIRDNVIQALNAQALSLTAPHRLLGLTFETDADVDEIVNGVKTFHHIATFRVWTEQTS
jgi:hypothetical protein